MFILKTVENYPIDSVLPHISSQQKWERWQALNLLHFFFPFPLSVVQQSLYVWNMPKDWRWNKMTDSYLHVNNWVNTANIEFVWCFLWLECSSVHIIYWLGQNHLFCMCWDMSAHLWHITKVTLCLSYIITLYFYPLYPTKYKSFVS